MAAVVVPSHVDLALLHEVVATATAGWPQDGRLTALLTFDGQGPLHTKTNTFLCIVAMKRPEETTQHNGTREIPGSRVPGVCVFILFHSSSPFLQVIRYYYVHQKTGEQTYEALSRGSSTSTHIMRYGNRKTTTKLTYEENRTIYMLLPSTLCSVMSLEGTRGYVAGEENAVKTFKDYLRSTLAKIANETHVMLHCVYNPNSQKHTTSIN